MNQKIAFILIILLVIASFLAGNFWTRVKHLETRSKRQESGEPVPTIVAERQIPTPAVLGTGVRAEIEKRGAASRGNPNAAVTIVEFSDYQCPFCKRFFDETYLKILKQYGEKVYYVFRDYPLASHQHAQKAAEAARCAEDQGKYWQYHDLLFEKREEWGDKQEISADLTNYAKGLGLALDEFSSCLSSGRYKEAVQDDFALGQKVGVSGTPTFFINGKMLVGAQPFENFKALIEEELD